MFTDAVERAVRWFQCPTDPAGVKKARYIDGGMWHIAFAASFNQTPKFVHRIDTLKAESHIACRAHAVPLPCRAAKGLECVFPVLFTQCGRV